MRRETGIHLENSTLTALSALDGMWAQLDAVRSHLAVVERPVDSFTIDEYVAKYDVPYESARSQLRNFVKSGKLKPHKVRGTSADGRSVVITAYTVAK